MPKITFMGAGSTVFAKNILGDCMCREALKDAEIALYDIDGARLKESELLINTLNANINADRALIKPKHAPNPFAGWCVHGHPPENREYSFLPDGI